MSASDAHIDRAARSIGIDPAGLSEKSRHGLRHMLETLAEAKMKLSADDYNRLQEWFVRECDRLGDAFIERNTCVDCQTRRVRRPGTYRCQECFDVAIGDRQ